MQRRGMDSHFVAEAATRLTVNDRGKRLQECSKVRIRAPRKFRPRSSRDQTPPRAAFRPRPHRYLLEAAQDRGRHLAIGRVGIERLLALTLWRLPAGSTARSSCPCASRFSRAGSAPSRRMIVSGDARCRSPMTRNPDPRSRASAAGPTPGSRRARRRAAPARPRPITAKPRGFSASEANLARNDGKSDTVASAPQAYGKPILVFDQHCRLDLFLEGLRRTGID